MRIYIYFCVFWGGGQVPNQIIQVGRCCSILNTLYGPPSPPGVINEPKTRNHSDRQYTSSKKISFDPYFWGWRVHHPSSAQGKVGATAYDILTSQMSLKDSFVLFGSHNQQCSELIPASLLRQSFLTGLRG